MGRGADAALIRPLDESVLLDRPDISTDGKEASLRMVSSLADRGSLGPGDDGVVDGDDGDVDLDDRSTESNLGMEKHPRKISLARKGCHGGSDGSGMTENISKMSSVDKTPSLSESN